MKRLLLIIMILLLTACNCDYEIEVDSKSIKENIKIDVNNADLYDYNENASIGDDASFLIEDDLHPLMNNSDIIYDKEIKDIDNGKEIILKHVFNSEDYKNYSYIINTCFENVDFNYNNGNYIINLSGYFYCYNGDVINISVKSGNVIKKSNGKKNGTTYQWTIDESNYENVSISIEISDESKIRHYIYIIIAVICGIGIIIFAIYFFGNIFGRDNVNSI